MELTAENVNKIFMDCLFKDEEPHDNAVVVEGLTTKFGLHPERLEKHKDEIRDMLKQLPDEFQEKTGGGWSFLNACLRKDGIQWAEHSTIQELLVLGIATANADYCLPRELWNLMPGGMPYFMVWDNGRKPPRSFEDLKSEAAQAS